MTVIIGSLFLPYTVQFEVDGPPECHYDNDKGITIDDHHPTPLPALVPAPINTKNLTSSILPSLSLANSHLATPLLGSPHANGSAATDEKEKAEEFFYKHHRLKKNGADQHLTDNLNEKLGPQFIQPKSRFNNLNLPSSVVDLKKEDHDLGLPSLRMNRSSNNLASLVNSATATHSPSPAPTRTRSSLSRPFAGFNFSNNSSSSLAIAEEHEEPTVNREWVEDLPDLKHERELAPFGGFSNPDIKGSLFNQENIFETAPWSVVFSNKGNVSVTKAVKLSVKSGVIHQRKWVGTLAMPSDEVPNHIIDDITKNLSEDYNSEAVFPNDITFQGHYNSFCKQILWPTFHYQIPDDPKSKAFEDHSWSHYQLLNQLVAEKIIEVYQRENGDADPEDPENLIWIHDYHLLLVPQMIRQKLPNVKIGLFLHVSFPSSEVFRCFAQRNEILRGMLGANCISFQTDEYVRHFLQTCNRLLLADTNEFGISFNGNHTTLSTIPVGIDANSVSEVVNCDSVQEWRQLIRDRWGSQNLIVSRDKLDKLRGIKQKLLAYEKFLQNNPEYVDTTVLIQICIGSSQDSDYEAEVMQIVARINSLSENISVSQPVVLLQKDIEFDQYVALLCEADTFVVSCMREGLNLTCHEFIIATTEKKSPLILSEFTGSSQLLECGGKGALLINPWDIKKFSEILKDLLTMEALEKMERWNNCHRLVITRDSTHWVRSCLSNINESWERNKRQNSNNLIPFSIDLFKKFYYGKTEKKRLFFFNFESPSATTAPTESKQGNSTVDGAGKSAYSEPARLASLLNGLFEDPDNQVYIISFLKRSDLDSLYRRYPNFGLIAENGGYIKMIGSSKWISIVDEDELKTWMPQVKQLIQSKVERLPGSFCEVEDCTIRFHAGTAFLEDRERALDAMGDCIQHINELFQDQEGGVHATLIKNVVVAQQHQLALKAFKFITSYYIQAESGTLIEEFDVKAVPTSVPNTPVKERDARLESLPKSSRISSIFISGGNTPIDEPNYEYANVLKKEGNVDRVQSVAVLGPDVEVRTAAKFGVHGKNELLGVISKSDL